MFQSEVQIRVRYGETDQMGFVYYGNYASYFEVARVEALRSVGFSYKAMEEQGIMLPVLENHSYYHKPAKYDDLLTVSVKVAKAPGVKLKFEYEIHNEAGDLIHTGATVLAFMNKQGRPCRPPVKLLDKLKPYFNGSLV